MIHDTFSLGDIQYFQGPPKPPLCGIYVTYHLLCNINKICLSIACITLALWFNQERTNKTLNPNSPLYLKHSSGFENIWKKPQNAWIPISTKGPLVFSVIL